MPRPKPIGDEALQQMPLQLKTGLINKLSYVAWFDRKPSKKAVVEEALEALLAKWEKKNGPITSEQIAEMNKTIGK